MLSFCMALLWEYNRQCVGVYQAGINCDCTCHVPELVLFVSELLSELVLFVSELVFSLSDLVFSLCSELVLLS